MGKGIGLIIQKQRADMETEGIALTWAMVLVTITIIGWFSGRWLAIHQTTRILRKKILRGNSFA